MASDPEKRLCEECHKRKASVHFTRIEDERAVTLHLCKQCAGEKGWEPQKSSPEVALSEVISELSKGSEGSENGECSFCGASLKDFRKWGRFGCAKCYTTFEAQVMHLLRRVHGSDRHVGKSAPSLTETLTAATEELRNLQRQLAMLVDREEFEEAAILRDKIRAIETRQGEAEADSDDQ